MNSSAQFLNPTEAARRLGVSTKTLRIYEQRGLILPRRTDAGWRAYGPSEMARGAEIVTLRELGLSLRQIAEFLTGDVLGVEPALAKHQVMLEGRVRQIIDTIKKIRVLRTDLANGQVLTFSELARLVKPESETSVTFELPWPWAGEQFELTDIRPLNFISGPLGSGKTRLAKRIAEALPNASFVGLDRLTDGSVAIAKRLNDDPKLRARVDQTLAWLVDDGGVASDALLALLTQLEAEGPAALVIDMLEQGLDKATQAALIARLRRRSADVRPIFILTRSNVILDLETVGTHEAIIFCPANHSPPIRVEPYPGASGYEAVATCLASPEVRARTEGVIAWRPQVA